MKITNGQVTFERSVRPADYETKRAVVNLSFNVDDGEDASEVIDEVGNLARRRALKMIGVADGDVDVTVDRAQQQTAPPTRPRRTRDIVVPLVTPQLLADGPNASPSDDANAKIAVDNEAALAALGIVPATVEQTVADVTDVTLGEAIVHKAAAAGAVKVRDLIWSFVPAPGVWKDIPREKRQSFLDQLKVLS